MRQFGKSREKKGKYSEKQNKTKVKMYPFKISKIFLPFFPPHTPQDVSPAGESQASAMCL